MKWLWFMLVAVVFFAAWSWFRPYEWGSDPGAGMRIAAVSVTRDHGNCWLDVHLRPCGGDYDWRRPARLILSDGREQAPADTRSVGSPERGMTELWLRFWLETGDLSGPLRLALNGGTLVVKREGPPRLAASGPRTFTSTRW